MRLALCLGKSLAEVEQLGSDELTAWIAFDSLYGLPDHYFTTAKLAMLMASLWGDGKHKLDIENLVPYFRVSRRHQTPENMNAVLKMIRSKRV